MLDTHWFIKIVFLYICSYVILYVISFILFFILASTNSNCVCSPESDADKETISDLGTIIINKRKKGIVTSLLVTGTLDWPVVFGEPYGARRLAGAVVRVRREMRGFRKRMHERM